MKKLILVLVAAAVAAGMVSAQNNPWGQTVTVEGTLQLQNGAIALASGNTVYFVPMLTRYVGFVEGLKEGAQISVQGYVGGYNTLMPAVFTVNGKSYTVSPVGMGRGYGAGCCGGNPGGTTGGWGRW